VGETEEQQPSQRSWPVTYEGVLCASQRHLRLTCGWAEFARAAGLRIGNTVTFERRGDDRRVLHVTVQRGEVGAEREEGHMQRG